MNDSIQSTLYGKDKKDSWKELRHLEEELNDIENLMSYDKRPVALANYDKRKNHLIALINQKKMVHGSDSAMTRQASSKNASPISEENPKFKKVAENKGIIETIYKNKSTLINKRMEENSNNVNVLFSNLVNTKNISK